MRFLAVCAVRAVGKVRVHDLECDVTVEPAVGGEVDRRHPAAGDPGHDAVTPVDKLADERIGQSGSHACESRAPGVMKP